VLVGGYAVRLSGRNNDVMSIPQSPVPGVGAVPGPPRPGGAEASADEARERLEQLEASPDASPAEVADALDEVRDALRRGLSDSGTG
jgi:hypothetical protein